MIAYVDTSAAIKLLVDEDESAALADHVEALREGGDTLVASLLLHTELRCAANRHPDEVSPDAVSDVLSAVALVDVERGDLMTAPLLPGRLRSADAIHLATALRVGAEEMIVYDPELRTATQTAGINWASPS